MSKNWSRVFIGAAGVAAVLLAVMLWPTSGSGAFVVTNMRADPRLSVMTYNVEGLPWPARWGRASDLDKIGARLAALRLVGEQPHIVALQEVFSDDARTIAQKSGYRYVVEGPDKDLAGGDAIHADDRSFAAQASFLKGERSGKLVGSGLQILSDYPVLSVKRMAFPRFACAGYDCLANKGAVLAMVAVPGLDSPLAVVDTHLNSHNASKVSDARSLYAYQRQIDALDRFLSANLKPGTPAIITGDFNVGNRPTRMAYFQSHVLRWEGLRGAAINDALRSCHRGGPDCESFPKEAGLSIARARDWQLAVAFPGKMPGVRAIRIPFGSELDGTMLSDHIGYTAVYGAAPRSVARIDTIASPATAIESGGITRAVI